MATPAVDQTYGQRSVFGALGQTATAPVDDDLECEDEHDALAYLALVRCEANKIPHVMVAPRPGPQAFPPGYAEAKEKKQGKKEELREARRKRNKRRQRHWDDQDDRPAGDTSGTEYGDGAKRRRTAELSYDEVSYDDLYDERPAEEKEDTKKGEEQGDNEEGEDGEEEEEDEDEEDDASNYNRQALYETGVGDARGYYHDGAYVAAGEASSAEGEGHTGNAKNGDDPAASDTAFSTAYRRRLLSHFADMRAHLALLSENCHVYGGEDTDVGPLSVRSGVFKHWLHILRTADPRPEQVAAMDKVSVLRLLRILQRGLEAGASTSSRSSRAGRFARALAGGPGQLDMSPRTIRWLWALFSRLPGRGELDYREVGYIRDLAKQAVMRLAHLSYDISGVDAMATAVVGAEAEEDEYGGEEEEYEYAGEEGEKNEEGEAPADAENPNVSESYKNHANGNGPECHAEADLDAEDIAMDIDSEPEEEKEKTALKAKAAADGAADLEMQQRAALEMVLAVAGEFYGQRDLLAFRSPWAVPNKSS